MVKTIETNGWYTRIVYRPFKERWRTGDRRRVWNTMPVGVRLRCWRVYLLSIALDLGGVGEGGMITGPAFVARCILFPINTMQNIVERELFGDWHDWKEGRLAR